MEMYTDRQQPYSEEAEKAVLGSILIDPNSIDKVNERLKPDDFYRQAHKQLFKVLNELHKAHKPIDLVTVTSELQDRKLLEETGGVPYLTELTDSVLTTSNVDYYVKIIEEKAIRRHVIRTATQIATDGYTGQNIDEIMISAEERIRNISERSASTSENRNVSLRDILIETFDDLENLSMGKIEPGIQTGFTDIDRIMGGLHQGELIILAARPSMGKTALALNLALNIALGSKDYPRKNVLIFSLEMEKKKLAQRMLSARANVDSQIFRTGKVKNEDWEKVTTCIGEIEAAPLKINDSAYTLAQIRADARKMHREMGIDLIIIDYLQLIGVDENFENANSRVGHISRSLKLMARELNVPVIAISQLSRGVEQRQDKRPMLSDLRDSGSIEQDADVVMFLYRDDYYNPDSERPNLAELIIGKQRNGPVGKVELLFLKNYNKFLSLDITSVKR